MKQRIIIFSVLMVTLTIQAQRMDNVTTHSPYIKAVDEYVPALDSLLTMLRNMKKETMLRQWCVSVRRVLLTTSVI